MFPWSKTCLFCLGTLLAISTGTPATAAEWSRETAHGGEINRSVTNDGGVYSGSATRTGPNGGSYTSNSKCTGGVVARCARSYSGVGPNGQTFSGKRASAHGPFRVRSAGSFTGRKGNTIVDFRRLRR
jgi:hypothetical protein